MAPRFLENFSALAVHRFAKQLTLRYIVVASVRQPFKFREAIILGKFSDLTDSYWFFPSEFWNICDWYSEFIYLISHDGTFDVQVRRLLASGPR